MESTPVMNAPGVLSIAEYLDCHMLVCSYNFYFLVIEVSDAVMRLVNKLFVNKFLEL